MNVNRKAIAVALGVVAMTGCSSSAKTSSTTTTAPPPARSTTTTRRRTGGSTTTTGAATPTTAGSVSPAVPGAAAVSASFVSPAHGWVLSADGHLDATTDGGRTWRRAGRVPNPHSTTRFLSNADGFAFTRGRGPLLITHDAGATWTSTPTPFTNVYDLAIARGMIDVTALQEGSQPAFRIWTSPVEHLVWKQVPPALAVGAGPVPAQQIVLAGGRGWIVNVNRTVIAGARLAPSGTWATWTPPCVHEFGPAYLSASTATDLAASCDEGVWGGNFSKVTPTVWFSHDGGATFTPQTAPVFGPVLSPNAQTAVVAGNQTLQRTTDDGATWTTVGRVPTGDTSDEGFTSSTQGFVITGGELLMTHDAGASWQPVTLP